MEHCSPSAASSVGARSAKQRAEQMPDIRLAFDSVALTDEEVRP